MEDVKLNSCKCKENIILSIDASQNLMRTLYVKLKLAGLNPGSTIGARIDVFDGDEMVATNYCKFKIPLNKTSICKVVPILIECDDIGSRKKYKVVVVSNRI